MADMAEWWASVGSEEGFIGGIDGGGGGSDVAVIVHSDLSNKLVFYDSFWYVYLVFECLCITFQSSG